MVPVIFYVLENELLSDEGEAKKIQKCAEKYTIMFGKLYKMGNVSPKMRCLGENAISLVLTEFHQGTSLTNY